MPWNVRTTVSERKGFIEEALKDRSNISGLCRQYGISRKTGNKWLSRYRQSGEHGLADRSRRPSRSPSRTSSVMEDRILAVRSEHPTWGSRKIGARLEHQERTGSGLIEIPSSSTITAILHRHGKISPEESRKRQAFTRFEREAPNDLWQMDFKGYVFYPGQGGVRLQCHPLTVLDDHSRFSLCLMACGNERHETVQRCLIETFRRYGLPVQMTMDNGSPWGGDAVYRHTRLTVWLMCLGIRVSHSRPYHPQTQGKDERFHKTLKDDLLERYTGGSLDEYQTAFDAFRTMYNTIRPHQALGNEVPASRYRQSELEYPETMPSIEYASDDVVRKVYDGGLIAFKGERYRVGGAFFGQRVAVRPTEVEGVFDVYFRNSVIRQINIRDAKEEPEGQQDG